MQVSLNDTKVGFRYKPTLELLKAYFLFSILRFPWLTLLLTKTVSLALRLHLPIEWLIRFTVFQQFCGGENVKECTKTIHRLWQFRVGTILDYSIEGADDEATFDQTLKELKSTIDLAASSECIPFCVFKPTGIGPFLVLEKLQAKTPLSPSEEKQWQAMQKRFFSLCEYASLKKVRLFIDAEETWIQDPVDRLAETAMQSFNRDKALIFTTVQMYRTDRLSYLKQLLGEAKSHSLQVGIKLVRGAYLEKERARSLSLGVVSPLHSDKAATDEAYNEALTLCLNHPKEFAICIASHNERSTELGTELVPSPREGITFAQLLGMSDALTFNLAKAGYSVGKYMPYGPVRSMMPYLFRRAQENTAISGQTLRELAAVRKELFRRLGLPARVSE